MKTTLTMIIAAVIFLTTPLMASAHEKGHDRGEHSHKTWMAERHQHDGVNSVYKHQREKQHLRKELRETRRDLHRVERRVRYVRNHNQPYYINPAVVVGLPHVVLRFDW